MVDGQLTVTLDVSRDGNAKIADTTLYRDDEYRLSSEEGGRNWSFNVEVPSGLDRAKVRTLVENTSTLNFTDKSVT